MVSSPTIGTDRQNPFKFVFRPVEFRRLPRWPNDGIAQETDRLFQVRGPAPPSTGRPDDADQRFLTKMFGGHWMHSLSLSSMEPAGKYIALRLPFGMQVVAAHAKRDHEAATLHLMEQYKEYNPEVRALLRHIQCKSAMHKTSRDPTRFPGVRAILGALFQHEMACEDSIQLLFGDLFRVLADVLEMGAEFAEPKPANSPAAAMQAAMFSTVTVAAAAKECANCGTQQGVLHCCVCDRNRLYCSKDCQKQDWTLHRPYCHKIRGMEVTPRILQKARDEYQRRQAQLDAEQVKTKQRLKNSFQAMVEEEGYEAPYSHDCSGKPRPAHFPFSAPFIQEMTAATLKLEYEMEVHLGMLPDGINHEDYSGRGGLIRDPATNAKILILHERLFADNGNGDLNGHALDGIFVVSKINRKRAVWKKVDKPKHEKDQNRYNRFAHYLQVAKQQAKVVPEDVDLGIHNPTMPNMQMIPTPFGAFTILS